MELFALVFVCLCLVVHTVSRIGHYFSIEGRRERQRRRFEACRERIAAAGKRRRDRSYVNNTRKQLRELARLTDRELRRVKGDVPPKLFAATKRAVAACVDELDFDRLYAIHRTVSEVDVEHLPQRLKGFAANG